MPATHAHHILRIYILYLLFRQVQGYSPTRVPPRAQPETARGTAMAAAIHLSPVELGLQPDTCDVFPDWSQLLMREPDCVSEIYPSASDYELASTFARVYIAIVAVLLLGLEHTAAIRMLM